MNMRLSVEEGHLCNMGRMIEEMEGKLRNSLEQVLWFLLSITAFLLYSSKTIFQNNEVAQLVGI